MQRILVIDDEPSMRELLGIMLRKEGFEVLLADSRASAAAMLARGPVSMVITDVKLPDGDGIEILRHVKAAAPETVVIVMTAFGSTQTAVGALKLGAHDYLIKPFALRELQARLRALLRRTGDDADGEVLRYGDLVLDPVAHEVHRGDRLVELSKTEFSLLQLFMQHPRQVLTRSTIFEHVWGYDFGPTSNALGVYMGYLRRKTEAGGEPRLLHTVRGVGYVLRE
jgi:two-component system response regulator MprA